MVRRAISSSCRRHAQLAFGEVPDEIAVIEDGASYLAPLARGQKTGWYYDQSANRARLSRYVAPGARVLDVCCYVGAWAVSALRHGAGSACCVDSSQAALDFAQANAARNAVSIEPLRADAFDALRQAGRAR